ncbi:MAG TPA: DNA polymerase III subunit beta [Nitrospiraceae bacterium]|jgi:DNA polymerase-3 subunit beta|nr:DNA polymerase III subunit beta [Nitrospiraceae bacterium]
MKLSISREELQDKLSNIQNIVEKRNTMPILSHFLLDAGESGSHIVATDLQVAIKEPLNASVQGAGKVCIPARRLFEIVREAEGNLTIESEDEQWIKVLYGKSRFRLACLASAEFPAWPGMEHTEEISFRTRDLSEMIDKTLYSAGETDTRYTLNGLLFDIRKEDNYIMVVGTDGHRLALIKKDLGMPSKEEKKVILPRKAAAEVKKFFAGEETITALFGKNHILFRLGDVHFLARLIEGAYPDYEKVIPPSNEKRITIERELFLRALRRVSVISKERSNAVRMDVSDGSLAFSSSNPDLGEARDEIEVEYGGEALSAGFNARYLIDSLSAMTTERVVFALHDSLSPTLLMEEGNEDYRCVIMPMRI